jgi:SpoVK/Ycf46/Vps4 family AAA+-type ATPase
MYPQLCHSQQKILDSLKKFATFGSVFEICGSTGTGKSLALKHLHQDLGGAFLQMKDFIDEMQGQNPLSIEETFDRLMMRTLHAHQTVILDDFHLLSQVTESQAYPRFGFLYVLLLKLCTYATETNKKLIFSTDSHCHRSVIKSHPETILLEIPGLQAEDYAVICQYYLASKVEIQLDYGKIHRFAGHLNGYQLRSACLNLLDVKNLDTDKFIDYLRSRQLTSNVDLGEVQAVDLGDLKGLDEVLKSLEINLILPLEHHELAKELNLKPKRGVLLAGPPGTGKTTIGRALAHRLKSKFFLIDGTFIAGTGDFYSDIHRVMQAAQQNAPSVVFIDDSDVIFEGRDEQGLYRYLLTLLDGLESESAGGVCIVMTAMNIRNIPPALVRSGRIELWLETSLPNEAARADILTCHLKSLPEVLSTADVSQLVTATEGFTGADLKRLIEDGKNLYAYDKVLSRPVKAATDYFLAAVETVLSNKERYATAEEQARKNQALRSPSHPLLEQLGLL